MSDKLTPFSVTCGKKPFDWNAFLAQEKYDQDELERAASLSAKWITCACGNQCTLIPRDEMGNPLDEKLSNLGYNFYAVITGMAGLKTSNGYTREEYKALAKTALAEIEARSEELLLAMGKAEL